MTLAPFAYPSLPHSRKHGPRGYDAYERFKPWLRDEFCFRCVYCLERELWYPDRTASFSVDHVEPQSRATALVCEYTNLVYACTRCNSARQDETLLDLTATAFGEHLRLGEDAILVGLTTEGRDLIDILHLNHNPALAVRRTHLGLLVLKERYPVDAEVEAQFLGAFGFPDDMPDLRTLRPPGGNSQSHSEHVCYFARREGRGLPATY